VHGTTDDHKPAASTAGMTDVSAGSSSTSTGPSGTARTAPLALGGAPPRYNSSSSSRSTRDHASDLELVRAYVAIDRATRRAAAIRVAEAIGRFLRRGDPCRDRTFVSPLARTCDDVHCGFPVEPWEAVRFRNSVFHAYCIAAILGGRDRMRAAA
jgi:hypothetical protein